MDAFKMCSVKCHLCNNPTHKILKQEELDYLIIVFGEGYLDLNIYNKILNWVGNFLHVGIYCLRVNLNSKFFLYKKKKLHKLMFDPAWAHYNIFSTYGE